jgi:hypothetical protein
VINMNNLIGRGGRVAVAVKAGAFLPPALVCDDDAGGYYAVERAPPLPPPPPLPLADCWRWADERSASVRAAFLAPAGVAVPAASSVGREHLAPLSRPAVGSRAALRQLCAGGSFMRPVLAAVGRTSVASHIVCLYTYCW